jgi:N-acetylglucosaminyldiphosphoundecaprenol N-acetyl-beta-D-mannosaminyltransferase
LKRNKVALFNVTFDNLTMDEAVREIDNIIIQNKRHNKADFVVTPNVDHIVNIHKNRLFKEAYQKAALTLVDGAPIVFLSKVFNKSLKEKVSGSDLTPRLFELAQKKQYRVFIFGSLPGVADLAIKRIKEEHGYNFPISSYSPPFGFESKEDTLNECINIIKQFNPDILLVSIGSPKGELFIYQNLEKLKVPLSIQVGASIDFIAGTVKRAPLWMQKYGLEWFYRFLKEPKRLFKRYFVNDSYFFLLIIKEIYSIYLKRK